MLKNDLIIHVSEVLPPKSNSQCSITEVNGYRRKLIRKQLALLIYCAACAKS